MKLTKEDLKSVHIYARIAASVVILAVIQLIISLYQGKGVRYVPEYFLLLGSAFFAGLVLYLGVFSAREIFPQDQDTTTPEESADGVNMLFAWLLLSIVTLISSAFFFLGKGH
jgi:uncharacterized membrane protein YgdD (TMEM256/DUF423 family)